VSVVVLPFGWWRTSMHSSGYDKALKQFRSICLALPETREVEAWGHPTFRAGKKMFAGFGEQDGIATIGLKVAMSGKRNSSAIVVSFRLPMQPIKAGCRCGLTERPTGMK